MRDAEAQEVESSGKYKKIRLSRPLNTPTDRDVKGLLAICKSIKLVNPANAFTAKLVMRFLMSILPVTNHSQKCARMPFAHTYSRCNLPSPRNVLAEMLARLLYDKSLSVDPSYENNHRNSLARTECPADSCIAQKHWQQGIEYPH